MRATVLVDNIANDELKGEWGLSIYIEFRNQNLLLDTGASDLFIKNANKLGLSISDVEYGVLSHAHYDHSDGMKQFFTNNSKAKFYLREGVKENCYTKYGILHRYIGIPKHILDQYKDRIDYAEGNYELTKGVTLVPHKTKGLDEIGKKNHMYIKNMDGWKPDDFAHEQSLVFDTKDGLIIFNSCCHAGADHVIDEVASTYPEKSIRALIGGFHIFQKKEEEVRQLARKIKATGIREIYTGHCTGEKSFLILKDELGDMVKQLHVGLTMDFSSRI